MKKTLLILLSILLNYQIQAKTVLASSFGYNASDATSAIIAAVTSSADTIIIDKQANDWMVGPISFTALRNKIIIFQPGVILRAKPGTFVNTNDCLLKLTGCKNIKIFGYGATFLMNKAEYIALNDGGESRMSIAINGCMNIEVHGLRLNQSGGDGIYITGTGANAYSSNIILQDLKVDSQYRQGISVVSAKNLLVQNCWFQNTSGWLPMSGVDLEPNNDQNYMSQIVFDRCRFTGNYGNGIQVSFQNFSSATPTIDVTFRDCYISSNHNPSNSYAAAEISITHYIPQDVGSAKGNVNFERCLVENSNWTAVNIAKDSDSFMANFHDCVFRNVSGKAYLGNNSPIYLQVISNSFPVPRFGGVSFNNCLLSYKTNYPFLGSAGSNQSAGIGNAQFNNITVVNPNPGISYNLTSGGGSPSVSCVFDFKVSTSLPASTVNLTADYNMLMCSLKNSVLESKNISGNVNYPVALTYSIAGTASQGVDYQLMNGFTIIPANTTYQNDTLFIIKNDTAALPKNIVLTLDTNQFYTVNSDPQTVTIIDCATGVKTNPALKTGIIYPNPSSDFIEIKLSDNYFGAVQVINELGQVVINQNGQGIITRINTSNLSKGIYFITFISQGSNFQQIRYKFIKN